MGAILFMYLLIKSLIRDDSHKIQFQKCIIINRLLCGHLSAIFFFNIMIGNPELDPFQKDKSCTQN